MFDWTVKKEVPLSLRPRNLYGKTFEKQPSESLYGQTFNPLPKLTPLSPGPRQGLLPSIQKVNDQKKYKVQKGDSLWKITQLLTGNGNNWPALYEENEGSIKNPDLIYPNQVLNLPRSFTALGLNSLPGTAPSLLPTPQSLKSLFDDERKTLGLPTINKNGSNSIFLAERQAMVDDSNDKRFAELRQKLFNPPKIEPIAKEAMLSGLASSHEPTFIPKLVQDVELAPENTMLRSMQLQSIPKSDSNWDKFNARLRASRNEVIAMEDMPKYDAPYALLADLIGGAEGFLTPMGLGGTAYKGLSGGTALLGKLGSKFIPKVASKTPTIASNALREGFAGAEYEALNANLNNREFSTQDAAMAGGLNLLGGIAGEAINSGAPAIKSLAKNVANDIKLKNGIKQAELTKTSELQASSNPLTDIQNAYRIPKKINHNEADAAYLLSQVGDIRPQPTANISRGSVQNVLDEANSFFDTQPKTLKSPTKYIMTTSEQKALAELEQGIQEAQNYVGHNDVLATYPPGTTIEQAYADIKAKKGIDLQKLADNYVKATNAKKTLTPQERSLGRTAGVIPQLKPRESLTGIPIPEPQPLPKLNPQIDLLAAQHPSVLRRTGNSFYGFNPPDVKPDADLELARELLGINKIKDTTGTLKPIGAVGSSSKGIAPERGLEPPVVNPELSISKDKSIHKSIALERELPKSEALTIPLKEMGEGGKTFPEPIIPKGMKESGVNKNLRTDTNRPLEMQENLTDNPNTYEPINNPETLAKAQAIYDEGLETAITKFEELNNSFSPEAPPLLKLIADELYRADNAVRANELISSAAEKATQAGQYSQAWRILRNAKDSSAFNMMIQKQIRKLNVDGLEAYSKNWTNIKLNHDELDAIGKLKPNDAKSHDELFEQIRSRIANELPSDIWEKVNAIRHMAMLGNIRTNVRNVGGNAIMLAMRKASRRLSGALQSENKALRPLQKVMRYDPTDRTQSFGIKEEYKKAANEYFEVNKKELLNSANKYLENIKLNMPDKRVFKNDALENLRRFNYKLLEMGDTPFFKNAYVDRLGSYAQSKGIKDFTSLPKEAFDTAFKEAQEATYKDVSKLAIYLNSVKNPGANASIGARVTSVLTEAVLPFTKTPINIVKRGIQYSPAGVINGIAKGGARGIDELAKGLTGTATVGLGYLLAQANILTGGASDDKDLREYNKATGNAPFSILGKYSYDWAAPFSTPLIIGVELYNAVKGNQDEAAKMEQIITNGTEQQKKEYIGIVASGLLDGFKASGDAILEMSLMQGVQNILGNPQGTMEGLTQIPQTYISQFVPTLLSQTAKTIDPVVRQTYIKGDKLGSLEATLKSKIPGASMSLEPKLTPYGEEMQRVGNPALRFLGEAISPGIIAMTQNGDPSVDSEIQRLAELGYKRQIPTIVSNYIEGTKKYPRLELTPQETTQYQKRTGELTLSSFKKTINSSDYKNPNSRSDKFKGMSVEAAREKILAELISEAKAKAKAEILKSKGY